MQSTQMQMLKFVKKEAPPFSAGTVSTPSGNVYRVSSDWSRADWWGMIRSRTGAFRMQYSVSPGLYAMGDPNKESDVFVTANYKLTFDILRRELKGMNAWVLALDTKSINVWCAAGKGTFGTKELIDRIANVKLDAVVSHRKIILPQLGAVGVNAAEVQKQTGFRVSFGPVEAKDIRAYAEAGYRKTDEMRTIRFTMLDRIVLTPMEINPAMKKYPWFAGVVLLLFGLRPEGLLFRDAFVGGMPFLLLGIVAVLSGAFLAPALLPFIPFRAFALKGLVMGLLTTGAALKLLGEHAPDHGLLLTAAWVLFPALSSYIALQFTGSTTFTGMSGVKKELRVGIPVYIGAAAVSVLLVVVSRFKEWGII